MKNIIQYKVINLYLNELGAKELNEWYESKLYRPRYDIKEGAIFGPPTKTYKMIKSFIKLGENNVIHRMWDHDNNGYYTLFYIQLKHINYQLIKLEITETETEVEKF